MLNHVRALLAKAVYGGSGHKRRVRRRRPNRGTPYVEVLEDRSLPSAAGGFANTQQLATALDVNPGTALQQVSQLANQSNQIEQDVRMIDHQVNFLAGQLSANGSSQIQQEVNQLISQAHALLSNADQISDQLFFLEGQLSSPGSASASGSTSASGSASDSGSTSAS